MVDKVFFYPIRKFINWAISNRHGGNIYRLCGKIFSGGALVGHGEESILITPITGYSQHAFEGFFARKATLHDKKVYGLICGGYLKQCEGFIDTLNFKSARCAYCFAQQEDLVRDMGMIPCTYSSELDNLNRVAVQEYCDTYFSQVNAQHFFMDVDVDELLYTALQRYYLIADPEIVDTGVVRGFLNSIISTLIVMDKLCKRIKPKYVLSSHGTYSTWGAVVEYCKKHGIYVITWGRNYNANGIEFSYDDSYLRRDMADTSNLWLTEPWDMTKQERATRFLDQRLGRISTGTVAYDYNKGNKQRYTKNEIQELLGIPEDNKVICMLPNIPWDGQVTGQSGVFPRFRDWLKATVDFFASRSGATLVIRSHPAEVLTGDAAGRETTATMLSELYPKGLPKNVMVLPPKHKINSYTLGENSIFGITYSSTITLELTHLGIPVILCGCPPFKGKDIGYDITSVERYYSLLEQGLAGNLSVDDARRERLYRFIHYFFFERTMPETLLKITDNGPVGLRFTSDMELDGDPVFDYMYQCIEKKEQMDFSRFYLLEKE